MRAAALFLLFTTQALAQPAQITLPEIPALELPAGKTELAPTDPPLRDLLTAATSGKLRITNDLDHPIGQGATRIAWTAWEGQKSLATKAATIFVLPTGMTPVGVSGDENATAANNATHIARDADGHVHMVWVDSGRQGARSGPVYRRATITSDGAVTLETPPTYIAEPGPGDWNAYPTLAVSLNTVHAAWQGGGTLRTRVLLPTSNGPVWGTSRDTLIKSGGRDIGPAMAARLDDVHIVTPGGGHVTSTNGGVSWKEDPMPLPPNGQVKTASVAIDPSGAVTVAFSFVVKSTANTAKNAGSGGYWQLRTIRRAKDGTWTGAADALAGLQGWTEPPPTEDALADWACVIADLSGAIHLAWHGTAISHIYGNDLSYYAFKPANGLLQAPIALVPPDPKTGIKFSFAPGLALDRTTAFALTFYDVYDGTKWRGFDSRLLRFRDGKPEGDPTQVTDFVRRAIDSNRPADTLSSRFPAPAPTVTHGPDGQIWLDILETLIPMGAPDAPKLIVYHRLKLAPQPN